jgi:hypothetical protein
MVRAKSPFRITRTDRYARIGDMGKDKRQLVEVRCPCCEAKLQIDPELKAVISYEEHQKPRAIEDISAAVQKMKGEEARRGETFQKSFDEHKGHHKVLERKFDELLKQAKENPDAPKPKRPFDFD